MDSGIQREHCGKILKMLSPVTQIVFCPFEDTDALAENRN